MEKMYIYGGYILTGGKLQDGRPWQGVNVMLAELKPGNAEPVFATVCKASRADSIMGTLESLAIGSCVHAYFGMPDSQGRAKLECITLV